MINSLVELDYDSNFSAFVDGLIPSLVCIIIVFLVLVVLSLIVSGLNHIKLLDDPVVVNKKEDIKIDEDDEDMMVAILVASIAYREEVKTDVKLVKAKRIL